MPTTRRSKRACADTNGDAVDPLSSGVEAESLSNARPKRIRVLTKKASPIKLAVRRPSTVRKAKTAPTKKTPRIVIRNTTEMPSEILESEYNVEEEPPARSGIDGVIVDPFNGDDDVDDNVDDDVRPPSPPPLPKSIFVKIQRDVRWFLPSRYLQAGGTEFELTLEFEFELEPPVNNDDLVVAASPTPIRGFSTPVLPTSRPSGSRSGRAGAPLPRGVSATPISNRGTPKAPSTRKSTSNTMAEEMYRRYEADIAKSRTDGVVTTRLVFDELHFRWKCDLGSKCKNFHLQVWATAIRDGKTTKDNPPAQFYRKWREVVEQQQQQAWQFNPSISSYPSCRAVTLDIPIRSSLPPPAPPISKTMAELINEFARQFARRYLMGAYNEQARAALNAVKRRLVEEGHSLECGLPGFLVAPLRGLVKTFLKEEVELATLDEGEYQQVQLVQPSSILLSVSDPYDADSPINASSPPPGQPLSNFLQSTDNEGDDNIDDEVLTIYVSEL
ncbi:hypothetical protein B0I37DRAFT_389273 [Chaetomium sp. MPI-CAGE-AT-0009]|nr:hypothetical protein B0I37DRAFT_389273 [Chaetomium sp. MPI-CAGE-AT-0009]